MAMVSTKRSISAVAFCFVLFLFGAPIIRAQAPIPAKFDGFYYKDRAASTDTIIIEAFLDPVCPDSRDSWPPLKQALEYYGPSVSLIVHPFPLPYHDNAFATSRALHIVNRVNGSATYGLLEKFFHYQELFYGSRTFNTSRASTINNITKFAAKAVGNSYYSALRSGFTDSETDLATRISFKYGASRGVYGTPFFFVNGIPLPGGGSAIDYNQWRSIIDPLVDKRRA